MYLITTLCFFKLRIYKIGKNVFTNPETGKYYKLGEIFKQPELLKVLQSIADDGIDEMYTGSWARDMASLVEKENGVITMSDMSNYTVNWRDPINTTYHDYFASTSGRYLLRSWLLYTHLSLMCSGKQRNELAITKPYLNLDFYRAPFLGKIDLIYAFSTFLSQHRMQFKQWIMR